MRNEISAAISLAVQEVYEKAMKREPVPFGWPPARDALAEEWQCSMLQSRLQWVGSPKAQKFFAALEHYVWGIDPVQALKEAWDEMEKQRDPTPEPWKSSTSSRSKRKGR